MRGGWRAAPGAARPLSTLAPRRWLLALRLSSPRPTTCEVAPGRIRPREAPATRGGHLQPPTASHRSRWVRERGELIFRPGLEGRRQNGTRRNGAPSARAPSVRCRAQRKPLGSTRRQDKSRAWPTPKAAHTGANWGVDASPDGGLTSEARHAGLEEREELGRKRRAWGKEERWERSGRLVEGKEEQRPLGLDMETWARATAALSRPPWRSATGKPGSTSDSSATRPSYPSPDRV